MTVLVLQVFVSLMLVAGSIALFVFTIRSRTLEHADRLALAPLEDDADAPADETAADPVKEESE